ncbi:MAG TPA: NAD-dependent deacylase [Syntrophales bacterium]|nr:NAD-dependent deacylase [Syntrophales bacterium]HOL58271.1 NAD-dependent deacylase [Syntrophales bacterium]HPO34440.1 NAD-dependent deacylase [Syntrophales bacterium]
MFEPKLQEKVKILADFIMKSKKTVVFTGAGVSTESGIPDFRSPGGIWSRFDPDDFTIDKFLYSPETRDRQWRFLVKSGLFHEVEPNDAHKTIAWLEKVGKLACVITQNIDNLHQRAGNDPERVYELHGNMNWMSCLNCGKRYSLDEVLTKFADSPHAPTCENCQGILKSEVVYFGEALPHRILAEASHHAATCDLFIVVGSSLVVYPAAFLPSYAKDAGARLVIINMTDTPFDSDADLVIRAAAGETMRKLKEELSSRLN